MAERAKPISDVLGEGYIDTLSTFNEKSQASDNLKTLQDTLNSFMLNNLLDVVQTGNLSDKSIQNAFSSISGKFNAPLGKGYGLGFGFNTPSPMGAGRDDYRLSFRKKFQEGGPVQTNDWDAPLGGLDEAIKEVNQLFSSQEGGAHLPDQTEFMKRVAATESNYGQDKLGDYSFSAFQLDPIRYKDIKEKGAGGNAKERIAVANKYLAKKLGRDDFDIMNLNLKEESHNPYIGAVLARLGLASVPKAIPKDLEGQADYWKKYWNTEAGKGTSEHFISQSQAHGMGESI